MKRLILASGSPRRAALLSQAGIEFDLLVVDYAEETACGYCKDPAEYAMQAAEKKLAAAAAVFKADSSAVIICADTIVAANGDIFGKPADAEDAARMLRALSGRVHQVHTGVALRGLPEISDVSFVETTDVRFHPLSDSLIEAYIETGEPFDKAGAYGIQDRAAVFVEKVDGCYANVVGLPVSRLARALSENYKIQLGEFWRPK